MTLSPSVILVTGAAGFIGANFVHYLLGADPDARVVSLDALTYAGNRSNLAALDNGKQDSPHKRHLFVHGDIGDRDLVRSLLQQHSPAAIVNFAAESHVDRSLSCPESFFATNVIGTMRLLDETLAWWNKLATDAKQAFRFLHVSTDEVYGSLGFADPAFTETSLYQPNSPYSASKAASDHIVRAWHHSWGLPVLTTNCSNNYGQYQFPEKLIPLMIHNALRGEPLPVYGDGKNVRDWLHVSDHCKALHRVLKAGTVGETYNIGGNAECSNIEVVHNICDILDALRPRTDGQSRRKQIVFVADRPGHDRRYAIDANKIRRQLGWTPEQTFATGLRQTIEWYLNNQPWVENITSGGYREWIEENYVKRSQAS